MALVTGASRGIGRAVALTLAARGTRVMCAARTERDLADLARHNSIEYVVASIDDPDDRARVVDETRCRLGPIAILVNNAGTGSAGERSIWDQDGARWQRTIDLNLTAPFDLTRLVVPDMIRLGYGRIVMVSSTAGQVGGPAMSAYCASKAGLLGLTRAVAQDVARFGITCNAVLPGWVKTVMADRKAEQEASERGTSVDRIWAERAAAYPAQRVLAETEVADVIAYLAGETSSGVNGETVTVALGGVW